MAPTSTIIRLKITPSSVVNGELSSNCLSTSNGNVGSEDDNARLYISSKYGKNVYIRRKINPFEKNLLTSFTVTCNTEDQSQKTLSTNFVAQ